MKSHYFMEIFPSVLSSRLHTYNIQEAMSADCRQEAHSKKKVQKQMETEFLKSYKKCLKSRSQFEKH